MNGSVPLERDALLSALLAELPAPWTERLDALRRDGRYALHIAVMRQPYLDLVLQGRKTIESRFSVNRVCPYESVEVGDIIAFKKQSGPVTGLARVDHAAFYELDPETWQHVRAKFARPLCADDAFFDERARARFATLLRVSSPTRIAGIALDKSDRRGWVRLAGRSPQCSFEL